MPDETFPLRTLLRAFPGIPVEEARVLIRSGVVKSYPEGTVLCTEDVYESTFYILLDGKVKVTKKVDPLGREVRLLKTLGPGDFFGEMALIQDAPRAATVSTTSPTSVLEIYKEDFDELLSASPSLSRALMQEVVSRLRSNDEMAIEDLRLKARELATAYQKLAEQEYARRQFLTTIAHELRTPLAAANGFLQMLQMTLGGVPDEANSEQQPVDTETLRTSLHSASHHIEQIITLVNDILFVQEMDLILPRFERVDLRAVLQAALESTQARQRDSRVRVHVEIPGELPTAAGDAASLTRAMAGVVDNAVKFSEPGGQVDIRADSEAGTVWIEVCDHGVGIAEDILPHIFDRFFHVDQIGGRLFGGVGLGLSISRQVIEQHKGKITADSRPGEGTVVRIELPTQEQG